MEAKRYPAGGDMRAEMVDVEARKVLRRLREHDFEAYLVGGCVRDLLIERTPKDFDVATSARPNQVKKLFRNCRLIGRRFRLAHILFKDGKIIEVSTFRANAGDAPEPGTNGASSDDGGGEDLLIRSDNVFGSEEEDALRRDFTVNGLFYDVGADQVIDYVGGMEDLEKRLIRTIGDPDIRIREDPVRILRAVKFASRMSFQIEDNLLDAMTRWGPEIARCATARVLEEVMRLLRSGHSRSALELLALTDVATVVLPELAPQLEDEDSRDRIYRYLGAADEIIADGRKLSDPVLLAGALLGATIGGDPDPAANEGMPLGVSDEVRSLMQQMALRLRVPRRQQERVRQVITAQPRLFAASGRNRLRNTLTRKSYIGDALDLYEIFSIAQGAGPEEARRWRAALPNGGGDMLGVRGRRDLGAAPRRRRRRGRRGRRSSEDESVTEAVTPEATTPGDGSFPLPSWEFVE